MPSDMNGAIDAIKELLERPDAAQTIESMLGAFVSGSSPYEADNEPKKDKQNDSIAPLGDIPIESVMKIANAYKSISKTNDPRITLLKAIKPYIRRERSESVDTAIKLLSLLRLAPLLGDLKDVL